MRNPHLLPLRKRLTAAQWNRRELKNFRRYLRRQDAAAREAVATITRPGFIARLFGRA